MSTNGFDFGFVEMDPSEFVNARGSLPSEKRTAFRNELKSWRPGTCKYVLFNTKIEAERFRSRVTAETYNTGWRDEHYRYYATSLTQEGEQWKLSVLYDGVRR